MYVGFLAESDEGESVIGKDSPSYSFDAITTLVKVFLHSALKQYMTALLNNRCHSPFLICSPDRLTSFCRQSLGILSVPISFSCSRPSLICHSLHIDHFFLSFAIWTAASECKQVPDKREL